MFTPEKDERLNRIAAEAGLYAFIFYFFFAMALMIAQGFLDWPVLSDPSFLLVVPWLLSGLVLIAFHIKGGYYTAVREEVTRTPRLLQQARIEALLTGIIAAAFYFLELRMNFFTNEDASLGDDLLRSATFGLALGTASWFMKARKGKKRAGEDA